MRQSFLTPQVGTAVAKRIQEKSNATRGRATRVPLSAFWLPLLAVMVSTGCNPKAKTAADISPVGSFALVSVDGNKVPSTVQHGGPPLTVKSGIFIINADGTCSSTVVFSPPSGGDVSRVVKATYTRQGPALTMKWEGAGTTTGTIEGDTFTMNNEGMIFTYRR
jgi:hypothetical protein